MVFVFLIAFSPSVSAAGYEVNSFNNSQIKVQSSDFGSDMRVMVEKSGEKYYYSLNSPQELLPAQLGNGAYTVKILKNIGGTKYRVLNTSKINLNDSGNDVYLSSSQPVYWEEDGLNNLANLLMKDALTEEDKVKAAYNYVTSNISYDIDKIKRIDTSYVPNVSSTIDSKSGICYDYAALFAGLLRSEGIPTKLVKGYGKFSKEYHAWNEVYVNDKWQVVDTTYDAAAVKAGANLVMYKAFKDYQKIREY
jgi:transglutaminase-like putative cysteine protease